MNQHTETLIAAIAICSVAGHALVALAIGMQEVAATPKSAICMTEDECRRILKRVVASGPRHYGDAAEWKA